MFAYSYKDFLGFRGRLIMGRGTGVELLVFPMEKAELRALVEFGD